MLRIVVMMAGAELWSKSGVRSRKRTLQTGLPSRIWNGSHQHRVGPSGGQPNKKAICDRCKSAIAWLCCPACLSFEAAIAGKARTRDGNHASIRW